MHEEQNDASEPKTEKAPESQSKDATEKSDEAKVAEGNDGCPSVEATSAEKPEEPKKE